MRITLLVLLFLRLYSYFSFCKDEAKGLGIPGDTIVYTELANNDTLFPSNFFALVTNYNNKDIAMFIVLVLTNDCREVRECRFFS